MNQPSKSTVTHYGQHTDSAGVLTNDAARQVPAQVLSTLRDSESLNLAAHILFVLLFQLVAWYAYYYLGFQGAKETFYAGPVIVFRAFQSPVFIAALVVTLLPLAFFRRLRWHGLDCGRPVRAFIGFVTLVSVWKFGFYDFNLYFAEAHLFDRALLLILGCGVLCNPAFLPMFLLMAVLLMGQFNQPFGAYTGSDKRALLDTLILFSCVLSLKGFRRLPLRWRGTEIGVGPLFVYLVLCMLGAFYFTAFCKKLALSPHLYEWMLMNEHVYLLVTKCARGWLSFLDPELLAALPTLVQKYQFLIGIGGICVELLGLVFLFRRGWAMFCLLCFVVLHGLIFVLSGIFFWEWMVVDTALILMLASLDERTRNLVFNKPAFLTSVAIIVVSPVSFFNPQSFGWWDTKLDNYTLVEAVGESGEVYQLANVFMTPYSLTFEQERFGFAADEKLISKGSSSVKSFEAFQEINAATSVEQVPALKEKWGANRFRPKQADKLDGFLRAYFTNLNEGRDRDLIFPKLQPPAHHAGTHLPQQLQRHDQIPERIVKVRLRLVETFYDGLEPIVFRDSAIREVVLD